MRTIIAVTIFCVCWMGASSSGAEVYTGRQLAAGLDAFVLPLDEADKNAMFRGGVAVGFIKGVCASLDKEDADLVPPEVTPGELAIVLREYLQKNRGDLDRPAAALVREGLRNKYRLVWPK